MVTLQSKSHKYLTTEKVLSGRDILCIIQRDWDVQRCTQEQILKRLARTNRVLVVERAISPLILKERPYYYKRLFKWIRGVRKVDNLFLYTSPPILPFSGTIPLIYRINTWLQVTYIKKIMKKKRINNPIHLIYYPWDVELTDRLTNNLVIYHCMDKQASPEYEPDPVQRERVKEMEERLFRRADLVLTTSRNLYNTAINFNKNTYMLPNGVDYKLFNKALSSECIVPEEIERIPEPRIGFTGIIDHRLDVKLILNLARKHPDWSFVFVGGVKKGLIDIRPLSALNNIYFLGMKKPEDLPIFIKGLSVCIIPYSITEEVKNIYPLKLHEYLAIGKPVVTTDMPELYHFKDIVRISKSEEEFEQNIIESLRNDSEEIVEKRVEIASQNTWDYRIKTMSDIIARFQAA